MSSWPPNDIPDQTGRVTLVTGANSGIGYEAALALAQKGAHRLVRGGTGGLLMPVHWGLFDLALHRWTELAERNPAMTFVYVSGAGLDAEGWAMWARVKGETEEALLALPFRAAYNARPAFIQPVGGAVSRTALYRALYAVMTPLLPLLRREFPRTFLDTDELGCALVEAGVAGAPQPTFEVPDLQALAARAERHAHSGV